MSSPPVISHLHRFSRRVRITTIFTGAAFLLAAFLAAILFIILADYSLHLPAAARLTLLLLAALLCIFILIKKITLPLLQRIPLSALAARIEQAFPQFHDRLRSTIDFTQPATPGSAAMKQRVITETTELFNQIDLRQAISPKPLRQSLASALAAILLIAAIAGLTSPSYRQLALERLLHPFAAPAWPKTVQIQLLSPLPRRIPVGQSLDFHIKLSRGDRASRKAILFYQLNNAAPQQQYMTRQPDGSYAATLDTRLDAAATGNLKTWITAGDDTENLPPISIVPRLAIQSISVQITPPAYANLPPMIADLSQGPLTATVASTLTLNIHFTKPLGSTPPTLEAIDGPPPPAQWILPKNSHEVPLAGSPNPAQLSSNTQAQSTWTLTNSLRFHIRATDADGFSNSAADEYQIIAKPDALPVIQIENPRRNEERTPEAIIPLQLSAADDFGIAAVNLHIANTTSSDSSHSSHLLTLLTSSHPSSSVTWTKTESTPGQQRYRLDYPWHLSDLHLTPGDTLEYHATAQDNYAIPNPKAHGPAVGSSTAAFLHHPEVSSNSLRITIITQDQLSQNVAEQMRQIADAVSQLRTQQTRTSEETKTFSADTAHKKNLDAADRAILSRLTDQQGSHAAEAKHLSIQLSDLLQQLQENQSPNNDLKQTATDAGQLLNQAAEQSMKPASDTLANLHDTPASPQQRSEQLAQTTQQQAQAADQLQRALDRLGSAGSLDQAINQIASLLHSQQQISKQTAAIAQNNLGKTPDQMSLADQKRLTQNAANQKSLADRTAAAMAQLAKQSAALSQSDPDTAAALSQASSTAEQQQVTPSQQKASDAINQNQQSDAQAAQAQAELGLQTILSQLHEAQRQKLAELSRHLADLQAQLAHLIQRQAHHNLDNLTLQGPAAPKTIDRKLLYGLAASAANSSPTLASLTTAQELTHRNTRDIATAADHLKGVSAVAGLLLQSADKMERASVLLEQSQLAPAYDPPQTDALSLLLSSQKKLQQIKSELDKQLADAERENLRQTYIKIKSNQQAIDAQTTTIIQSPRLLDGSLNRISAIQLLQLPPQQKTLADRVAKLDDRLSSLGSIVYLWANHDLHDTMISAASSSTLQTLPTLPPLQTQILQDLDAMIDSLATSPKKDEFAQRPSGGGSGKQNQKPRLPDEAELRLMKQFESNLKTQTASANLDRAHTGAPTGGGTSARGEQSRTVPLNALSQRQSQLRTLLNQLLQKASQGQLKLPPETPNKNILPEETKTNDSNTDLANQLLNSAPMAADTSDPITLLGNRMSRSSQRLGLNHDPGPITQTIQQNILTGLDKLIDEARKQQSQSQSQQQQQQEAQQNSQITKNPQQQQPMQLTQPPHASTPAQSSNVTGSAQTQTDLNADIRQNMRQWGTLSDRQRQAILQGTSDTPIEKYKPLIDDYYRTLAEQSK